jgi:hypothetical protein
LKKREPVESETPFDGLRERRALLVEPVETLKERESMESETPLILSKKKPLMKH